MGKFPRRENRSLRRKVETRRPRKTFMLFCEGQRTEPEYLAALKRDPEVRDVAAVELRIETRGVGSLPLALVKRAIQAREKVMKEEGEVDEFWCVFDVEWPRNHPGLADAIALARRNDIQLAISNPCFELWLAWHFKDHSSFLDNDAARRLRRECDSQDDKGVAGGRYMDRKKQAVERAEKLDRWHERNETSFPDNNPSSGMHRLVNAVLPQGSGVFR